MKNLFYVETESDSYKRQLCSTRHGVSREDIWRKLLRNEIESISEFRSVKQVKIGITLPDYGYVTDRDTGKGVSYLRGMNHENPESIFYAEKQLDASKSYYLDSLAEFLKDPANSDVVVITLDSQRFRFSSDVKTLIEKVLNLGLGTLDTNLDAVRINTQTKKISRIGYSQIFIDGNCEAARVYGIRSGKKRKMYIGDIVTRNGEWREYGRNGSPSTYFEELAYVKSKYFPNRDVLL